jgi:hypothetical protein
MVELLKFLVLAVLMDFWKRVASDASARLVARVLQAEFFLALDLNHLGVVHGDLYRTKAQIAQGALDLAQDGGFVMAVNAT